MNIFKLFLLLSLVTSISCSKKKSGGDSDDDFIVDNPAIEVEEPEGDSDDDSDGGDVGFEEIIGVLQGEQKFEGFASDSNWYLSDFGLDGESKKDDYHQDFDINFDIQWTKRTRNLLADRLGYTRQEMTRELANSICEPKIEVGKEHVYVGGESNNTIAELDTDLKHCGINGYKPAAVRIRSFIKTEVGHQYKLRLKYRMRTYSQMPDNAYKELVVRFGRELEKFEPEFDEFKMVEVDMVAINKFSKLVIHDNGLPDSYGILVDDIEVYSLGPVEVYNECKEAFSLNSKGFKKCVVGEIATDLECEFNQNAFVKASKEDSVAPDRRDQSNIFNMSPAQTGNVNFFALGLKGKLRVSCSLDGQAGLLDIFGKTLSFQEISWGNQTLESYPELAKVRVKLQDCVNEDLNRTITLGTVGTNQSFSYEFSTDEEQRSYEGCKMDKLVIKDITPDGPSIDGFDINSLSIN